MTEGLWPEGVVELRAFDRLILLIVGNGDLDGTAALGAVGIRRRELKEGLPYQSLIAGILHQYIHRSTPQTN